MDTRTRNSLCNTFYLAGSTPISSSLLQTGEQQTITSVRSGHFVPGQWRWNPCTIVRKIATSEYGRITDRRNKVFAGDLMMPIVNATGGVSWLSKWGPAASGKWLNHASVDAHSKLVASNLLAGVSMGELRETLELLRSPLKQGIKYFRRFLNGRRLRPSSHSVKYLADKWLEARYGWGPLMSEIEEAIDNVCSSKFWGEGAKLRYTKGKSGPHRTMAKTDFEIGVFDNQFSFQGYIIESFEETCRHTVCNRMDFTGMTTGEILSHMFGLTGNDAASTAYEMVPFSFVVDWWYDIGSWLEAIKPKPYLIITGQGASTKTIYEKRWHITSGKVKDPYTGLWHDYYKKPGDFVIRQVSYDRGAGVDWMFPPTKIEFGSVKHTIDTLSYMVSSFVGKKSKC